MPPRPDSGVTIGDGPVSLDEVVAIAHGASVTLAGAALERIRAGRELLAAAVARGEAVYGVNTQVGHGRDVRLDDEAVRHQQAMLVMTHAGGIGPPLPAAVVRAALAVRLTGIARGGAAASPAAAEVLVAMLNAGVHPVVAEIGSVGAGDLGHMAGMAQVAIGAGRAELGGEVLPGGEALRRAGIAPLVPGGRDGLALIASNGVSVGRAALVLARATQVARAADLVAALALEAVRGNPSIVHPSVGAAKPFPGQIDAARAVRDALEGGALLEPGAPHSVQDPLSFRVVPQVHGALREQLAQARRAAEIELNADPDNPLASIDDGAMVHNGNFHPVMLAVTCDALRVALAHVGQLSDRRMSHLWEAWMGEVSAGNAGLPTDGPPPSMPGLALRYPAAARFAELRQLAGPASLDTGPLDNGVEDHSTSAPLSVARTDDALGLLADVLAVEVLLARDLLAVRPVARLGQGTAALLRSTEAALADAAGPEPAAAHAALRARFPAPG